VGRTDDMETADYDGCLNNFNMQDDDLTHGVGCLSGALVAVR